MKDEGGSMKSEALRGSMYFFTLYSLPLYFFTLCALRAFVVNVFSSFDDRPTTTDDRRPRMDSRVRLPSAVCRPPSAVRRLPSHV
jgi:hypothetical protein